MSYSRPRGTYDVYPGGREPNEQPGMWRWIEDTARDFFRRYNYSEVRSPIFEEAQLFIRGMGEASDVVRKEMFVFEDKAGREMSLRPEGTAGVIRSYIEHGLDRRAQPLKLWYMGPMFRHERQQKGSLPPTHPDRGGSPGRRRPARGCGSNSASLRHSPGGRRRA